MSDTISRQDAINGIYKEFKTVYCWNCDNQDTDYCEDCHRKYMQWSASKETVESVINGLPSADPNAIQRIQRVGSVDLISRQAVLDFPIRIDHYDEEHGNLDFVLGIESVMEYVESLPSTDPKRDDENEIKFFYVESIDDYWIGGVRIDNFYYATWWSGMGFVWSHSRYLPWGEHIVDENTLWKEHTYPSEPKEMPFTEWIRGFVKKYFTGADMRGDTK